MSAQPRVTDDSPAAAFWGGLLAHCLKHGFQEIHIVPDLPIGSAFRLRKGTDWEPLGLLGSPAIVPTLVQRLKVMANLDLGHRAPREEGSFRYHVEGFEYDFRVTTEVVDRVSEYRVHVPPIHAAV